MKPEEAIEMLRGMQNKKVDYAELVCAPAFASGYTYVYPEPEDYAIEEAISALKEIQQYRKIGTVEEFEKLKLAENGIIWGLIDEYVAYKQVGTVEECREAVEKQKPKNIEKIREGEYCCPKCYTVYDDCIFEYDYCINCGQAIQWENLEGMEDEL